MINNDNNDNNNNNQIETLEINTIIFVKYLIIEK